MAIPSKKQNKTPSFDTPWFGLSCGDFAIVLKQSGEIPVAIPRFLLRNKKKHRHSIRRGLVFLTVPLPLFIRLFLIGNFVMVGSPRFRKSSGIDPRKALLNIIRIIGVFLS